MTKNRMEAERMMGHALKTVPKAQAILQAWMPFKRLIGVTSVNTDREHNLT